MTTTTSVRGKPPVIDGERVAGALTAAHRRLADPANWSPRGYPYHEDGEPVTSSRGLRDPDVRAGLLDTIDVVCGEDLDLQVAAIAALRAALDASELPHNLRSIDRALGRQVPLWLLASAIGHARAGTWEGHAPLVLPDGPPNRETYEALCLLAQLIEEIHLASEPCAGRHYATWTINDHLEGELREIERYLDVHERRVRGLQRAQRRRERFAGGLRATAGRKLMRLLTRAHLRRDPEQLPDLPF